jgi:PadR family transcriptional regulator PadR
VRRKPGTLLPLELEILRTAAELARDGAAQFHGFQLAKHLATAADRRRLTAFGTLYRALARLEDMGLVESRWEDAQIAAREGRPIRRLYALTSAAPAAIAHARPAPKRQPARRRKVAPA